MNAKPAMLAPRPALRVDYVDAGHAAATPDPHTLALFRFGSGHPAGDDPRVVTVPLQPFGAAPVEVWRVPGAVVSGADGDLRWSEGDGLQFGVVEVDEADAGGPAAAAEQAYARLRACLDQRGHHHPLRVWNYLADITRGEGDAERYRQFCIGRARGLGAFDETRLPAATAIGHHGPRRLQVYWLAAREPGIPLENPRQVSAYRYPRQYGPQPPSFARAMLPPAGSGMPLLLSGTASVVGHETRHVDCVAAQLDETFANFDILLSSAHGQRPELPADFGRGSRLKVYVRDEAALPQVAALLDARLGDAVPRILLHADICRRDLRVEIDGVHAPA